MTARMTRKSGSVRRRKNVSRAASARALRIESLETRAVMDYASAVLGQNPLFFFNFNEASGNALDSSPNGFVGQFNGTSSRTTGRTGLPGDSSATFTANGAVRVADVSSLLDTINANQQITVSFWLKQASATSSAAFGSTGQAARAHLPWSDSNIYWDTGGCCASPSQRLNTFEPASVWGGNVWHHWAFVKDGVNKSVYVDGAPLFSGTGATAAMGLIDFFYIGSSDNFVDPFTGQIDDFAVFNKPLSAQQISDQFNGISLQVTWDGGAGPGDTSWTNPLNWVGDSNIPDLPTETAIFGNTGAGNVNVNGNFTINAVQFTNTTGSYNLAGGGLSLKSITHGGTQSNTIGSTVTINNNALGTTIGNYTGGDPGDGLDLQGSFLWALNVGGVGNITAGDAIFVGTDNPPNTLALPPGVTMTAPNQITSFNTPNLGATPADDALETISGSIRWASGAPGVQVSLANLTVGQTYKVQLLFSDNGAGRDFDVFVEGNMIASNFAPGVVQAGVGTHGAVITHTFVATDNTLDISLPYASGVLGDPNPILSGITVETLGSAAVTATGGTLNLTGSVSLPTGTIPFGGTGAINVAGAISGGASSNIDKTGTGTLTLSGNNTTFAGTINIVGGRVTAASNNALGTVAAGTTVRTGAELALSGGVTIGEPINLAGGTLRNLAGSNTVTSALAASSPIAPSSSVGVFTGGDVGEGLDLDGTFAYAVNMGGPAAGAVRDANFTSALNSGTTAGVTYNGSGQILNWINPDYGATTNDNNLELVMQSIRHLGGNGQMTVDLANVVVGGTYKLQLLYQEGCCAGRAFDISVEGTLVADNYFTNSSGANATNGGVVTRVFTAGDTTVNILMDGPAAPGTDQNPVIFGLTLEVLALPTPLNILSDAGTLNLNGTVDIGPGGNSVFGGAGEIIVNGNVIGGAAATVTKTGTGALRINAQTPVGTAFTVNGGTLAGTGDIRGNVTVNSPGALGSGSAAAVGTLTVDGNVIFNNLSAEAARIAVASNDRVKVNGTVTLNGLITPSVTNVAPFNATTGQVFVLLQNDGADPITGTFSGIAEGGTLTVGTNQYQVSYLYNAETSTPGTGNDIALIAVNRPPIAIAGGPYSVTEGTSLVLNGAASSDPDGDTPLTYSWDVNGDSVYGDATGVNPTLTWAQLVALGIVDGAAPPGTVLLSKISVRVSDPESSSNSPYVNLTVVNGVPTAIVTGGSTAVPGNPYSITLTATDPSPTDQASSFTYDIDWGDGNTDTVSGVGAVPAEHIYIDFGVFPITVTATDKDTGVSAPIVKNVLLVPVAKIGDDIVVAGTNSDDRIVFTPNNGSTTVRITTAGATTLYGPFPTSTLSRLIASGFGGNDNITISSSKWGLPVSFSGGDGNDYLAGSSYDDTLNGDAGNDKLLGAVGNDVLDGGDDNDSLDGGAGDDTIFGGAGNDKGLGGAGNDVMNGGDDNDSFDGGTGNDLLRGEAGNDTLVGNSGDDIVLGGDDNDRLVTAAGNDVLIGGDGKDSFDAGAGDDLLVTGTTDLDTETDDSILLAALDDWTNARDVTALGTINGDADTENLVGGIGADLFYMNANDNAKDYKASQGDVIEFL